jgi:uncharacterized protein YbbK (DUF523 family)
MLLAYSWIYAIEKFGATVLITGSGVTAHLLMSNKIKVFNEHLPVRSSKIYN